MTIATLELIHELLKRERDAKCDVYRKAAEAHRAAVDNQDTRAEVIADLKEARGKALDEYDDINIALSDFESCDW